MGFHRFIRKNRAPPLLSALLLALLLIQPFSVLAVVYQPGQTLDPACLPTDTNCGVTPPTQFPETGLNLTSATTASSSTANQLYNLNGILYWGATAIAGLSAPVSLSSLNGLATSTQTFATGSSGTDFNIVSSGSVHTFNIPTASSTARGLLSSADWTTFNNKLAAALASGKIFVGDGSNVATAVTMSGDATISNAGALTLANSGVTSGTYGSTSTIPVITIDAKGRITNASATTTPFLSAAVTSLNGLTVATQTFATSTSGTDFTITSSGSAHTFVLPSASGSARGLLSSTDWSTFNNKLTSTLNSAQIFVGNGSNVATAVTMSGDATLSNAGVLTIVADSVVLGTDTTGNYVAGNTAGTGISISGTATESWSPTITIDQTAGLAWTGAHSFNNLAGVNLNPYGTSAGNTTALLFKELAANGTNYVGFKAGDSLAANVIWTLPTADGSSGQALSTNGSGGLSWVSAGGLSINTIDSQTKSANGAVISGNTLVLQTADASSPGLVSTTTQTFAGAKTFTGATTLATTTATGLTINTNGLTISSSTPAATSSTLYNQSGTLYWNGTVLGGVAASFMRVSASAQQTNVLNGSNITFDTIVHSFGSDITFNNAADTFTLKGGKTYSLRLVIPWISNQVGRWQWHDGTSYIGQKGQSDILGGPASFAEAIVTPASDTTYSAKVIAQSTDGTVDLGDTASGLVPWAEIEVIAGLAPVTGQTVASGEAFLTANQTLTTSYANISGMSVTLPVTGTYELTAEIRTLGLDPNEFSEYQFFNSTAGIAIANSERLGFYMNAGTFSDAQTTITLHAFVTTTAANTVITAQGKVNATAGGGVVATDVSGKSRISYKQLGTSAIAGTTVMHQGNALGSALQIGTIDSNALTFITGNSERVRVDASGNVGIGTTNPSGTTLMVNGNLGFAGVSASYISDRINFAGNGVNNNGPASFYVLGSGSVGVRLDNGNTAWSAQSDIDLKTNIEPLAAASGLDAILRLNPINFNWKDSGAASSTQIGFIAQEVERVLPGLVSFDRNLTTPYTPNGTYFLNTQGIIPSLVKSIQEIVALGATFKQALITWFADATNNIGDFFTKKIHTEKICLKKSDGSEYCVSGDDLEMIMGGRGEIVPAPSPAPEQSPTNDLSSGQTEQGSPIIENQESQPEDAASSLLESRGLLTGQATDTIIEDVSSIAGTQSAELAPPTTESTEKTIR